MKPRALILALLLVAGFWYVTGHGDWNVQQVLKPLSTSGKLWSEPVTAHGFSYGADEQNNIDIYKSNHLATVNITSIVYQRDIFFQVFPSKGIGSGFLINADGDILTNNHVIAGSRNVTVTLSGNDNKQYKATIVGLDRRADLAILHISANRKLPFVHLGNSDDLVVGQKVLAIGNPFGLGGTLTTGIVSSLNRSLENEDGNQMEGLIQTDAAINPGNSGGPMFDSQGNVIGINTAIYSPGNRGEAGSIGIGFAIPINRAKEKLAEYQSTGHLSHPVLGITQVVLVQGDFAEELNLPPSGGLLIEGVDDGSPAAAAGLRGPSRVAIVGMYRLGIGGDLIIAIDGNPVNSQDSLRRALDRKKAGEAMEFTIFRNGRTSKVRVTLGSAPEVL